MKQPCFGGSESMKQPDKAGEAPVLIGNTFPLSLIRRRVEIAPVALAELVALLQNRPVASFWGHTSTIHAANAILGIDVTPATARPPIQLSPDGLPSLDGIVFTECFALSPDYVPGFRPAIGEEVPAGKITGWQVLRILW